eukprot:13127-Heterococcus_DN1.PRE.1
MEYMSHYMPYTGEAAVGGVDRLHSPVRNKVLQMFGNQERGGVLDDDLLMQMLSELHTQEVSLIA